MVGIVVVAHSSKLVEGVADLIKMMAPEMLVSMAGGQEDGSYGISTNLIRQAFRQMREVDDALVFLDLGSSYTIVKSVMEEFPKNKFHIMDCPMVEGSISAAVVASGGAPIVDVIRVAKETRNAFKF